MFEAHTADHSEAVGDKVERVLHLIDLENLVGSADFTREDAARVHRGYVQVAPSGAVNQMVLATSHHAAAHAWFGWPATARRLVRSGQDGADLALLHVLACESVVARFDRIVIGSGDGIFAYEAARLQAAGVALSVVTGRGALSRQLSFAVRDVRYLEPIEVAPVIALRLGNA
jgi:hypothetical protein